MGPPGPQSAAEFVLEHGRFPQLGVDAKPPWKFPGWLLFSLQAAEMQIHGENSRWLHYLRTLEAGHLIVEPIPPIHFGHEGRITCEGSSGHKALNQWTEIVFHEQGPLGELRGCSTSFLGPRVGQRSATVPEKLNETLYHEVNLTDLLQQSYDYFGDHDASNKTNKI